MTKFLVQMKKKITNIGKRERERKDKQTKPYLGWKKSNYYPKKAQR